jgi:hypothetical protein
MDGILPFSIAVRKMLFLPVRCVCPINSSSDEGRIRSARGTKEFIGQISEEYLNMKFLRIFCVGALTFYLEA